MKQIFSSGWQVAAILSLMLAIFGTYFSGSKLAIQQQNLAVDNALREMTDRIFIAILDAETGQRGFLLTGKESYLEPFFRGRDVVKVETENVKRLHLNAAQTAFVQATKPLIDAKMNELKQTITLRQKSGFIAALAIVKSDSGKIHMEHIRTAFFNERLRAQKEFAADSRDVSYWTQATIYSLIIGAGSLVMLMFGGRKKKIPQSIEATPALLEVQPVVPFERDASGLPKVLNYWGNT